MSSIYLFRKTKSKLSFCTLEISMHLFNKSGCGKKSHHIVLRSFCQISASLPVPHKVNTLSLQLNYLAINRKPTATFFRLLFQLILVSDNLVVSEAPCLPLCGWQQVDSLRPPPILFSATSLYFSGLHPIVKFWRYYEADREIIPQTPSLP